MALKSLILLVIGSKNIRFCSLQNGPNSIVILGNLLGAGQPAGPVQTDFLLTFLIQKHAARAKMSKKTIVIWVYLLVFSNF